MSSSAPDSESELLLAMTTSSSSPLLLLSTFAPFIGNWWPELALASLETESLFFNTSLFTLSLFTTDPCFEVGVVLCVVGSGWATAAIGGGGGGWSLEGAAGKSLGRLIEAEPESIHAESIKLALLINV